MTTLLSIVVPVYNSELTLRELVARIKSSVSNIQINLEIILVDDRSIDNSWDLIDELCVGDESIIGIRLSRNFGQHNAISAGLDISKGDWVVVMDADLQDLPEDIPRLYERALEGFDQIIGRRTSRQDSFLKRLGSKIFWTVFKFLSGEKITSNIGNFGLYSRSVIDAICELKEQNRAFGLMASWVGFKRTDIEVARAQRVSGKSEYSFRKMLRLAARGIISHSERLLYLTVATGVTFVLIGLSYAGFLTFRYLINDSVYPGWSSIISVIIFSSGVIICSVGVVALYVGEVFSQTKNRPIYFVSETVNTNRI